MKQKINTVWYTKKYDRQSHIQTDTPSLSLGLTSLNIPTYVPSKTFPAFTLLSKTTKKDLMQEKFDF